MTVTFMARAEARLMEIPRWHTANPSPDRRVGPPLDGALLTGETEAMVSAWR
jgi:hypothetical protein